MSTKPAGQDVPGFQLRDQLRALFEIGHHPLYPPPQDPGDLEGTIFQQLHFSNASHEKVRAFYVPPKNTAPGPAVLYIHAHGARYDIGARELIDGRPALAGPMGQSLADLGCAVLCIDLPGFGERCDKSESALAKKALWYGGSLAGQMLGELHSAFHWLGSQDGVDSSRIGLFGLSMGATFAYWLAAAEPRVAAVTHLCCFADFAALIETDAHDLHGPYLTIPNLLNVASNGQIAGAIAPRPQFVGIGDQDPLTPPHAADPALGELRAAYSGSAEHLHIVRDAEAGHTETPDMRRAVLKFFASSL